MHKVKKSSIFLLFLLIISTVISVSAQKRVSNLRVAETFKSETVFSPAEPRLATAKTSYAIGETVFITGSGFGKFEPVAFIVERVDDIRQTNDPAASWTGFSDENGNISGEWQVPFAGRFIINVAGENGAKTQAVVSAGVTPVVVSGNPSCATLNASSDPAFAHIVSNFGFKVEPPASGTFPYTSSGGQLTGGAPADPANSLTLSILSSTTFDWSSTRSISAVIVKAGSQANVYPYNPASLGDQNLNTGSNNAISHIEVCFGPPAASITIIKDAQPNTPQSFDFKASGQVSQDFSLVDNGVVGPDRIQFTGLTGFGAGNSVTITEGASAPFSLIQISCTSNGSGVENNTINVPVRFATIQLEPGENVVCTFVNAITTAANVSAGGRVTDAFGKPISNARVTIQNSADGETRTVSTGSFGYYRFEDLPSGNIYIITVSHRRYGFSQGTQVFALNDAVENVDFVADLQ